MEPRTCPMCGDQYYAEYPGDDYCCEMCELAARTADIYAATDACPEDMRVVWE